MNTDVQPYKPSEEGGGLISPSSSLIHHMITSDPKHACVFIKTHLDPDWQAFAALHHLTTWVFVCLYAMALFTNYPIHVHT